MPATKGKSTFALNTIGDYTGSTNIQSLIESHLIYNGVVTGKRYEWFKAGDLVSVSDSDVPELLGKRLGGNPCCGESGGNKIFQIAN